jgi:rubredoxin
MYNVVYRCAGGCGLVLQTSEGGREELLGVLDKCGWEQMGNKWYCKKCAAKERVRGEPRGGERRDDNNDV